MLHTLGIFEFAVGVVTGFGTLAIAMFGGPDTSIDIDESLSSFVLAGIHYLSGLVPIGATHVLLVVGLSKGVTLFLAGILVSVLYNVFAAFDEVISEVAWAAERRFASDSRNT